MIRKRADRALAERVWERLLPYYDPEEGADCCLRQYVRCEKTVRKVRLLHPLLLRELVSVPIELCLAEGSQDRRRAHSTARTPLRRAVDLMRKGMEEGRAALFGLRSPASPDGSLEKALYDHRDDFAPGEWTRIVILGKTKPLASAVQQQLFLIAQEALLNARRHAEASRVEVEIQYAPQEVRVVVRDNGVGIDAQLLLSGGHSHFGLTSMSERAASIGATIRVWSKRGGGTEVEVSVPLAESDREPG